MRTIDEIIIHSTATRSEWMYVDPVSEKVNEIRRWHVEGNGWSDIGYHYIIDRDGVVGAGRPVETAGAHARGNNANSIGVALVGGFGGEATDEFEDNYTGSQEAALIRLLGELQGEHGELKITGHNEYSSKACPCFNVSQWLTGQQTAPRTHIAQSKTLKASAAIKVATAAVPIAAIAGDMPLKNLVVILVSAAIVLVLTGIIDIERLKKWKRGDK